MMDLNLQQPFREPMFPRSWWEARRGASPVCDETFGKKWFGKITKDCLDSFFDDFDDLENALVVKLSTFFFFEAISLSPSPSVKTASGSGM